MDGQNRSQSVRFDNQIVQIQTVRIRGVECLRLVDVQRRWQSVEIFSINNIQQAFVTDENRKDIQPLHIVACPNQVIDAISPIKSSKDDRLRVIEENTNIMMLQNERIYSNTQEILAQIKCMMRQMYELHEYTTPRYFCILPARNHDWSVINGAKNCYQIHYKLYFLCECSDDPKKMHFAPHDGYSIKQPKEFVAKFGPYLRTTLNIVQLLLSVAGFIIPQAANISTFIGQNIPAPLQHMDILSIRDRLEFSNQFLDQTGNSLMDVSEYLSQQEKSNKTPVQGKDLRELESFLKIVDEKNSLGNLYRTVTSDGHVRWVCLEHYDKMSHHNKMSDYIGQLVAMGGQFNQEKNQANLNLVKITSKNVEILSNSLTNGFNVVKLIIENCSISEGDFDTLIDVIINRSSIRSLQIVCLDIRNWVGQMKYICESINITFQNQSMQIDFNGCYRDGNIQIFDRIIQKNQIYLNLHLFTCDFFGHEDKLQRSLNSSNIFTKLIVDDANNIDILNSIFNRKNNTIQQLKFNHSLCLPSTSFYFCEMLKNENIVEIDLIDSIGFSSDAFLFDLFKTLREHQSIKYLSLHIFNLQPSDNKQISLIDSLTKDRFLSRLRLSQSTISDELTQAFTYASQQQHSLTHLEFFSCLIYQKNLQQIQSLYDNEHLIYLTFSQERSTILNRYLDRKWKQEGHMFNMDYQLSKPRGLFLDESDESIYIVDCSNHRIVKWNKHSQTNVTIPAGGYGQGANRNQFNFPTDLILDYQRNSLIVTDWGNKRLIEWSLSHSNTQQQILISDIDCFGLTMDKYGHLYISDTHKHQVRKWRREENKGFILAGANGQGDRLDQLNRPTYLCIDDDNSLYISDTDNHRVVKWTANAKEGIVVAGGNGPGRSLNQLHCPKGLFVDRFEQIYIADDHNHRIIKWIKGAKQGTIVVGRDGFGYRSDQLYCPEDLLFDKKGNLYVSDYGNNRIQIFEIDQDNLSS